MRAKLVLGLVALVFGQMGCIIADGQGILRRGGSDLLELCGQRPSQRVVEQLVRTECGGIANLRLRCQSPRLRQVAGPDGVPIHGWHVTAELTIQPGKAGEMMTVGVSSMASSGSSCPTSTSS